VEFVPLLEDRGIIKYSLEEYMEVDDDLKVLNQLQSTTRGGSCRAKHHEKLMLQQLFKIRGNSPMEMTIEETLKLRADERRKKLKIQLQVS
jgi:cell division protein FtsZ